MDTGSVPLLVLLKRHFGYEDFRPGQREIISGALAGRHSLVVMPTGGGKSLCYQLPALALRGLTLVVSPLIALMKDQVDALRANGIPAAFLNSSLDNTTAAAVERSAQNGRINLLYAAPERITMPGFQRFLRTLDLKLIAIDEAHCISEWGHDFRPDYRALSQLRALFPDVPVMALTATATERVRRDIVSQLALAPCDEFLSSFDRPNLRYRVLPRKGAREALLALLSERRGQAAIVYCISRRETEEIAADLTAAGHAAVAYHAGLDANARRRTQEMFIDGEVPVVVATIAFGMGIDKADIRLVVHQTLPKSIEGYLQETGRAGRDGLPSDCVLFFSEGDQRRHDYFINRIDDDELHRAARQQLDTTVRYARRQSCRRQYLLEYFGETMAGDECGNCDVCASVRQTVDVTVIAKKILSAVIRTGERFGIAHVSDVLLGSGSSRIKQLEHDRLSVFGIVDDYDRSGLRQVAHELIEQGILATSGGQYPTISVPGAGRTWLRSEQSLMLAMRIPEPAPAQPRGTHARPVTSSTSATTHDAALFERFKILRRRMADAQGVPAFVVFNDATLRNLAAAKPTQPQEMLRVSGVGPAKLEKYGEEFLAAIRQHAGGNPLTDTDSNRSVKSAPNNPLADTHESTLGLLEQGLSVPEIATRRGLTYGTVVAHIERIHAAGRQVDLAPLLPPPRRVDRIMDALDTMGLVRLAPVKELLGDDYSYEEIRLVRMAYQRDKQ